MPSTLDLSLLARQLLAAQDGGQRMTPISSLEPAFDLPSAYAVAKFIDDARVARGDVHAGRKLGFTNAAMWPIYGVGAPVWAPLYERTVVHLSQAQGTCSLGGFIDPKIEPEIVVHFRAAPPPGGDLRAILASIDWVANAFEIVQSRYPGWKFQAPDTVADAALHATLLVGPPQAVGELGDDVIARLESFEIELSCDGQPRERGTGANVLGSPLAAIAHLMDVLAAQPAFQPLRAGELVTTGTITTAHPVRPGETWSTRVNGIALPGLSVQFTG